MRDILLVDDEPNILKVMAMRLEGSGYRVCTAANGGEAIDRAGTRAFDGAIVDLRLPDMDGIGVMEQLHQINPELPVIILTHYGTIESAVDAMKKGAHSYLTKPFEYQDLLRQMASAMEKGGLAKEIKRLREVIGQRFDFGHVIAGSSSMERVMDQVLHAAQSDAVVCIEGESGTGKELIARALHLASPRREGPFVPINCAAIPETLFESELFGYEKGAFTGATQSRKGFLVEANGGSLFLDEISETPLPMQTKLLRVLQEKQFYPVGARTQVGFDARIIAATNKNLWEEVTKGLFREDLFYRIHVIPIRVPPLRERKESIPVLARRFLKTFSEKAKKDIQGFTPEAMQRLTLHSWPGNVRELENTVEYAVTMARQDVITEDLVLPSSNLSLPEPGMKPLKEAKEDFERNYLSELISMTRGNISHAARVAGKYRADLYALLRKHRLNPADIRKEPGND